MSLRFDQLYPHKLMFNKCPIRVAIQTNYPFSFSQNTSDGKLWFRGFEVDLVDMASVALNLTTVFKLSLTDDAGMTYENGTPTEPTVWVNFTLTMKSAPTNDPKDCNLRF